MRCEPVHEFTEADKSVFADLAAHTNAEFVYEGSALSTVRRALKGDYQDMMKELKEVLPQLRPFECTLHHDGWEDSRGKQGLGNKGLVQGNSWGKVLFLDFLRVLPAIVGAIVGTKFLGVQ